MKKENGYFQDTDEDYSVIVMKDTETGEDTEFVIVDMIDVNENNYLLVAEAQNIYDDNPEVLILKESILKGTNETTYIVIEDDKEIEEVIQLLNESSDNYDIQI